ELIKTRTVSVGRGTRMPRADGRGFPLGDLPSGGKSRTVKIFELTFPQEVVPLLSPVLRLVLHSPFTHTRRPYREQRLGGEAMDWKYLLAYITGTVDQELLLRNESLVTEHRILRSQIMECMRLSDGECLSAGYRYTTRAVIEIALEHV